MRIFSIDVVTPTGLSPLCRFNQLGLANGPKSATGLRGVQYQKANGICAAEGDANLTPTANHNERLRFDMGDQDIDYSIFPVTEDEWIDALTADDNGHISCVHPGLAQYLAGWLTPYGTLRNTTSAFKTPLAMTRFMVALDMKARVPWRGTGMSAWELREERDARRLEGATGAEICDLGFKDETDLYFIGAEDGPIKIGVSANVSKRLRSLQTGYPAKLHLWAVIRQAGTLEGHYHKKFAEHRMHGEWFARHPELLAEIDRITGDA